MTNQTEPIDIDYTQIKGKFNTEYYQQQIDNCWSDSKFVLKYLENDRYRLSLHYRKIDKKLLNDPYFSIIVLLNSFEKHNKDNITYFPKDMLFSQLFFDYVNKGFLDDNVNAYQHGLCIIMEFLCLEFDKIKGKTDKKSVLYCQRFIDSFAKNSQFLNVIYSLSKYSWEGIYPTLLPYIDFNDNNYPYILKYCSVNDFKNMPTSFLLKEETILSLLDKIDCDSSFKYDNSIFSSIQENQDINLWFSQKEKAITILKSLPKRSINDCRFVIRFYSLLSPVLRQDKSVINAVCYENHEIDTLFQYIPPTLYNKQSWIDYFLKKDHINFINFIFEHVESFPQFKDTNYLYAFKDTKIQGYLVSKNWNLLLDKNCPSSWKNNADIYKIALLKNNYHISTIRNHEYLEQFPLLIQEEIKNDKEMMTYFIDEDPSFYYLLNEEQKSKYAFIHIKKWVRHYTQKESKELTTILPSSLHQDISFLLNIYCEFSSNHKLYQHYIKSHLFYDREFILKFFNEKLFDVHAPQEKLVPFSHVMKLLEANSIEEKDYTSFLYDQFKKETLNEDLQKDLIINPKKSITNKI